MTTTKQVRNYTIDIMRVLAGVIMATFHWIWAYGGGDRVVINSYWGAYTYPNGLTGWDWFKGNYTMGFFVFVTGYFFVNHFKKLQRKGAFGGGHDGEQVYRFTANTYVKWAPLMLIGVTSHWIMANSHAGSDFMTWVNTLVWNIWQFVGISGFGMLQRVTANSQYITTYAAQLWYVAAYIAFCCFFYCIFVKDEKVAVFIVCPLALALANVSLDSPSWWANDPTMLTGIELLVPSDIVRLWGPLAYGIWGWYLVDAVKRSKLSKGIENGLGIAFLVLLAYALVTTWTGYLGGMLNQDFVWMAVACICLIQRDPVTRAINNFVDKLPFKNYLADISAGFYIMHEQILLVYGVDFAEMAGGSYGKGGLIYLGVCVVAAILATLLLRVVLRPLYGKLGNALKLNRPVGQMFDDQVSA